jgi:cell division protein FtsI (penicillin-binding protein 3)
MSSVSADSKGAKGIEVQYNAVLNGNKNAWMMGRDALGREIAEGEIPFHREEHFRNVMLTLDKHIQHVVETELSRSVQKWGAKGGFVIAMDRLTGKILALANYPSFNPNQFLHTTQV